MLTRYGRLIAIHALGAAAGVSLAHGFHSDPTGTTDRGRIAAWAAECARNPSFEIEWLATQEIVTETGEFAESFDYRLTARYDYPEQMDVITRYVATGHPMDSIWATEVNKDVRIGPDGRWLESTPLSGTARDLGDKHRLRDLVRSESINAPVLVGMWINEHPDQYELIDRDEFGTIIFEVPELLKRVTLVDTSSGRDAWVSKLEAIDTNGTVLGWWLYDDPILIDGTTVKTGSIRTPVSIKGQTMPREGLSANLEHARRVEPPALETASSGSTDEAAPSSARSTETGSAIGAKQIWWVTIGVVLLGAVTGVCFWLRRST